MSAGRAEGLAAVLRELRRGLGDGEEQADPAWLGGQEARPWPAASPAQEELVTTLRTELALLAAAAQNEGGNAAQERAVGTALDGAELVIRSEIAAGRESAIRFYLPSFAFIVALPGLGRKRALELSREAERLLAKE